MNRSAELIEFSNPRTILENQELEDETSPSIDEYIFALSRMLAWQVEGKEPRLIGLRTLVICHVINPEIINGMTLNEIGALFGYGRSAVQKLSDDFTTTFNVHGIHQRSKETKTKLSQAWHKSHEQKSITENPGGSQYFGSDSA